MKRGLLFLIACAGLLLPRASAAQQTRMVHVYNATPEELGAGAVRTYFDAGSMAEPEIEAFRRRLIDAGARNVNWFGDNVVVAELPKGSDAAALTPPGVSRNAESDVPDLAGGSTSLLSQVKAAYALAERLSSPDVPRVSPGSDFTEALGTATPEQIERARKEMMRRPGMSSSGVQKALNQNSEILTGSIKVYLILPESNGQTDPDLEDWFKADGSESQDLINARVGAFAAFLDYQSQFPGMGIDYRMIYLTPESRYEPILHTMADDYKWILDVMQRLDSELASLNDPLVAVHLWNEKNKGTYDWIYTAFIGHSRTIIGHKFGDGNASYTAYANLGGPYLVNPYPAGGDPNNIGEDLVYSQIIQHESGHVFWTLDEYPGAPGTCATTSGYLNYTNMNVNQTTPDGIVTRCIPEVDCIMDQAPRQNLGRPFCRWSRGHLGVIDDNGNAIPDVFEAPPVIIFEGAAAETVVTDEITVRVEVRSQAVPNQNNHIAPEDRVDYAAPLRETMFSLGGGWIKLSAADGRWDGTVEETSVHFSGLPPGATKLKFRARNSVGLYSDEYVKTIYFLGINYAHLRVDPRANHNVVTWEAVGETFGAAFDVYRVGPGEELPNLYAITPGEPLPGTLVASDVQPSGPGRQGFVPYTASDPGVAPGISYRYYVNARGEVQFEGSSRLFYSPSTVVTQTAMIPVPTGRLVSHVSPNPSRGEVSMSIDVPASYTRVTAGGGSYDQRVATPVEVTIYNVLGRRVRTLRNDPSFDDVITLRWDGRSDGGIVVSSGVYFIRVKAGEESAVEKVLMLR